MKSKISSIILILFVLAMVLMLGSCATYQKKLNKFQTFAINNPAELAKLCADKFPVRETTKPGRIDTIPGKTVYLPGDSIPCPDGTKVKAPDKKIQCPPSTVCTPDTVTIEDTAKLFVALDERDKVKAELKVSEKNLKDQKDLTAEEKRKARNRLWTIYGLIAIIAGGVLAKIKGII